jgi:hypothetical protein
MEYNRKNPQYIVTKEYDGGCRGGHHCLCGRQIRYIFEVERSNNLGASDKFPAQLGSECSGNLLSERVQKLLATHFEKYPETVFSPLPF